VFALRHSEIPDGTPDFLYLCGPVPTLDRELSLDVLDIKHRLPPRFLMIVDGRKKRVAFLR
jgi:hypothetical protein